MQKERKIDLLLLARYFSGSISREECAGVEEWMSQSNENRVLAKQIQYMFHTSDALAALNKTNARAALTRVKTRIRKKKRIAALKRAALPVNAIIL
ncbi:MAG: hypothetical protein LBQ39_10420, partial [Tannerellaceae bacterium]|nr:hypothetical protein [Tannerellaceae bacterium]